MSEPLVTVRIYVDKYVRLFIKSPTLEAFFKGYHESVGYSNEDYSRAKTWGKGIQGYIAPSDPRFQCFQHWGGRLYEKGKPNLSFLLALGLSDGVTFTLTNSMITENIANRFVSDLKVELARIFQDYMTSICIEDKLVFKDDDLV